MATGGSPHRSPFFAKALRRARRILEDPQALVQLAKDAEGKAAGLTSGPLSGVLDELKVLLRLIRAYGKGEYRKVSWKTMVLVVGAVLYLVSPVDVIPDFILGSGLVDDATVLAFVYRKVHKEVAEFLEWERASGTGPEQA